MSPKNLSNPAQSYIQSYNSYINEHSELPVIARHRNEQQLFNVLSRNQNSILTSEKIRTMVSDPKSSTFFEQFGTVITDQALQKQAQRSSNPSKYIAATFREIEPLLPSSLKRGLQVGKMPALFQEQALENNLALRTLDHSALDKRILEVRKT